jgi:hypothetical protein
VSGEGQIPVPEPVVTRRCPQCGTIMTPARYDPRVGVPVVLRLPGRRGREAIRLGHQSVFLLRGQLRDDGDDDAD